MTTEEFKNFSTAMKEAPKPQPAAAAATVAKVERPTVSPLRETVMIPAVSEPAEEPRHCEPVRTLAWQSPEISKKPEQIATSARKEPPRNDAEDLKEPEVEQSSIPMPEAQDWRMVGELYNSYIIVEQGDEAFLIDKHAAHERILFEKLKADQEKISSQSLLAPVPVRLSAAACAELLSNRGMLEELGFEIDEFGENTVLLRQIPMDLTPDLAAESLDTIASDLMNGRRGNKDTVRDEVLHTVACKAAIKAGWKNDEAELLAVAKAVMAREDLKYCPHGRPICITLSKKQLERQFKRT